MGWPLNCRSPRTTPTWPIPRATLEFQSSNRLKELATPKIRNNIWSIQMSEVGGSCPGAGRELPARGLLLCWQVLPVSLSVLGLALGGPSLPMWAQSHLKASHSARALQLRGGGLGVAQQ